MANLRREDGLGRNPERTALRAQQLTTIDPGRNCPWPLDWQRHCHLAHLAEDEPDGVLPDITPGVRWTAATSDDGSNGDAGAGDCYQAFNRNDCRCWACSASRRHLPPRRPTPGILRSGDQTASSSRMIRSGWSGATAAPHDLRVVRARGAALPPARAPRTSRTWGKLRHVVERTFSLPHHFKRLASIRWSTCATPYRSRTQYRWRSST